MYGLKVLLSFILPIHTSTNNCVMTVLSTQKRRNDKQFWSVKKPSTIKQQIVKSVSSTNYPAQHLNLEMSFQKGKIEKPQVNIETEKMIEDEVSDLFGDRKVCNIRDVAAALRGSNRVRRTLNGVSPAGTFADQFRKLTIKYNRGWIPIDATQLNNYAFLEALKKLEWSKHAGEQRIHSWPQAKEILSDYVIFPPADQNNDSSLEEVLDIYPTTVTTHTKKKRFQNRIALDPFDIVAAPSNRKWAIVTGEATPPLIADEKKDALQIEIDLKNSEAEALRKEERQILEENERRMKEKEREEEARKLAAQLMRPFTAEEQNIIKSAIWGAGRNDEVIASVGPDSVQRESMHRLQPGQWLNDEVIHYFLVMLGKRDEDLCLKEPGKKRSHFFKSFFMTKLLNEGSASCDGKYEYRNVKRWSKKVPGKDIFALDKIFFPINQGGYHWICAVAFMQEKRIQMYDSMGTPGTTYLEHILHYFQDEHMDKKKKTLPDIDKWQLVPCTADTPLQENGMYILSFFLFFLSFRRLSHKLYPHSLCMK